LHEYDPKQYTFSSVKFCNAIAKIAAKEITKYNKDGAHKFFNPAIAIV
jgi:hypothetical protein